MNVNELLSNGEKFIGELIEVEGTLIVDNIDPRNWYIVEGEHFDFTKALSVVRPVDSQDTSPKALSDLTRQLAIVAGIISLPHVAANYVVRGQILLKGTVARLNKSNAPFGIIDVQEIVFGGVTEQVTSYLKRQIQFDDTPQMTHEVISIPKLVKNLDTFLNHQIQLEGYLRGSTQPEICYIVPHDDRLKQVHEVKSKVLVDKPGILEDGNIVGMKLGGRYTYFENVRIIGRLTESDDKRFIAAITHLRHLIIKTSEYCINVWNFGDSMDTTCK